MTEFEQFSQRIQARLAAARREPSCQPAETSRLMSEREPRRHLFDETAQRLVETIIRPRMETLASFFPNTKADRKEHADRCAYWFGYCNRFPTNARVEIAVEHDEGIKDLIVHYELYLMPVFLKFDAHDKLTIPICKIDEQAVAEWVEAKLLQFLDTYLELDRGEDDFEDEVAVDPVCGMRISRSAAAAKMEYKGHPYYFCSESCRQQFAEEPLRYVRFETE